MRKVTDSELLSLLPLVGGEKLVDAMVKSGASNDDLSMVPALVAADFLRNKVTHKITDVVPYDPRKMDAADYINAYSKVLEAGLFKWKVGIKKVEGENEKEDDTWREE